jgi:hypothetical protein
MPDKRLIHVQADIGRISRFADSIGLLLFRPRYLNHEKVQPEKPPAFAELSKGSILFCRREWIFDEIQTMLLDAGINAGKYVLRESTNWAPISFSFSGELDVDGVHRLGVGSISFKREYLAEPAHEMRPAPPDMDDVYNQLCKHLLSGVIARGGGFRYHVCHEAAELTRRKETRPPFDYIEWPPADLHKKRRVAKK